MARMSNLDYKFYGTTKPWQESVVEIELLDGTYIYAVAMYEFDAGLGLHCAFKCFTDENGMKINISDFMAYDQDAAMSHANVMERSHIIKWAETADNEYVKPGTLRLM